MYTLVKLTGETLTYAIDFGSDGPPASERATTWPQGNLLAAGESLTGAPTLTVVRSDGQASDLTVSSTSVSGSKILFTLAGGSDGVTYVVTGSAATTTGETRLGQGALAVSVDLPD